MAYQLYDNRGEPIPPKKLKRISREVAERKLARLLERVKEVNALPDSKVLYSFRAIWVFGSYLTDAPTLGDLDILYDLRHRAAFSVKADREIGKRDAPGFIERSPYYYSWGSHFCKTRLRGGDGYIHALEIGENTPSPDDDEIIDIGKNKRLVYSHYFPQKFSKSGAEDDIKYGLGDAP